MVELLKKDFGICKMAILLAASILVLPYIVNAIYNLWLVGLEPDEIREVWGRSMLHGSQISMVLTMLSFPFLAGYIIAGERSLRTAEFLGYLPASRASILFSKFLVCASWALAVTAMYLLVLLVVVQWLLPQGLQGPRLENFGDEILMFSSTAAAMFGVSWMLSCMIRSPVLAVCGGIVAPWLLMVILYSTSVYFGWSVGDVVSEYSVPLLNSVASIVSFVIGCVCFLRRTEP